MASVGRGQERTGRIQEPVEDLLLSEVAFREIAEFSWSLNRIVQIVDPS
jgi:hypothetical protein